MAQKECSICVENFNKSTRAKCHCPHCNYSACRDCVQQYILTIDEYEISCMNCKKLWTYNTLDGMITKTFRNLTLKNHRQKILLDREKSLLPATQPEVKRIITVRKCEENLKELSEQKRNIIMQMNKEMHKIRLLENGEESSEIMKEKRIFSINCPRDECRGFVQNPTWECGICSHFSCEKCHEYIGETKDTEHTCKEENVQTAILIKKDSKPCPGCSTFIFKISGCNQMWCTKCHTTFSWNTGAIIKGTVHNPHFYEWMQKNATQNNQRNLGDVPCGGLMHITQLQRLINAALLKSKKDPANEIHSKTMYNMHRVSSDIEHDKLPTYRTSNITNNTDLRVKFLLNELSEEDLKSTLQKREKKIIKYKEIYDVLEMYLFTSIDMFNNLLNEYNHNSKYDITTVELSNSQFVVLQEFANEQLKKISIRYACKVPLISTEPKTIKYK